MFEQILEVMPDDEMALRTLYDAYTHVGQREKAFDMLKRLGDVALEVDERELIEFLVGQYADFEDIADEPARELLAQLESHLSAPPEKAAAEKAVGGVPLEDIRAPEVGADDRKDAELSLAWNLYQDGQLPQDDYSQVLQDLNEMASKKVSVPVTVLHVLSDRSFSHFSAVVTYLSQQTGAPFISLANFEISDDMLAILPYDFVKQNAAICFKMIGNELLIAVLNPFDRKLLEAVSQMTGRRCHPFLVVPEEYDELLKRIAELQQVSA